MTYITTTFGRKMCICNPWYVWITYAYFHYFPVKLRLLYFYFIHLSTFYLFIIKIPIVCIINKFKVLDVSRLFVASTTPSISSFSFLLYFCDSKKVMSSGILVINPSVIPTISCGTLNILHKFSKLFPNNSPTIYNKIPVIIKIKIYNIVFLTSIFP